MEIDKEGVHWTHCGFGENEGCCKYGDKDCPVMKLITAERWRFGESLCCLIGNTMLDNMEAGKLLAEQLTPTLKWCKGE